MTGSVLRPATEKCSNADFMRFDFSLYIWSTPFFSYSYVIFVGSKVVLAASIFIITSHSIHNESEHLDAKIPRKTQKSLTGSV